MKLRTLALSTLLAAAACGKSSDLPRLQEEASSIVSVYTPRVDALQRRVKELDQRGQALGGAANDAPAKQLYSQARAKVDQLRGLLQSLPGATQEAAKTNNAEELEKLIDESRERIEKDSTEAIDELDAVESWMWTTEGARATQNAQGEPAPTPPPGSGTNTGTGAQPGTPTGTTGAATDGTSPPPTAAPTPPGQGSDAGRRVP